MWTAETHKKKAQKISLFRMKMYREGDRRMIRLNGFLFRWFCCVEIESTRLFQLCVVSNRCYFLLSTDRMSVPFSFIYSNCLIVSHLLRVYGPQFSYDIICSQCWVVVVVVAVDVVSLRIVVPSLSLSFLPTGRALSNPFTLISTVHVLGRRAAVML